MEELSDYVGRQGYVARNIGRDELEFLGAATVEKKDDKYCFRFNDKELLISQGDIEKIVDEQQTLRITLKRK